MMSTVMTDRITRLEISRFQLKSRSRRADGALLRVWFDETVFGISELMPWTSLGDPSLETLIGELRAGRFELRLIDRALAMARIEADARKKQEPLFAVPVENHFLAMGQGPLAPGDWLDIRRRGFSAVKIKISKATELSAMLAMAPSWIGNLRLRLDMNAKAGADELLVELDRLPILVRDRIDFIEDPIPFDSAAWREFSRRSGIRLMLDREGAELSVDEKIECFRSGVVGGFVHKPGWSTDDEALALAKAGAPVVVTSLLGHPVGQLHAARVASLLPPSLGAPTVHGCFSHIAYDQGVEFKYLQTAGPKILPMLWPAEALMKVKWEGL